MVRCLPLRRCVARCSAALGRAALSIILQLQASARSNERLVQHGAACAAQDNSATSACVAAVPQLCRCTHAAEAPWPAGCSRSTHKWPNTCSIYVCVLQTYKQATVYPGPRLNLVLGPNGAQLPLMHMRRVDLVLRIPAMLQCTHAYNSIGHAHCCMKWCRVMSRTGASELECIAARCCCQLVHAAPFSHAIKQQVLPHQRACRVWQELHRVCCGPRLVRQLKGAPSPSFRAWKRSPSGQREPRMMPQKPMADASCRLQARHACAHHGLAHTSRKHRKMRTLGLQSKIVDPCTLQPPCTL